MDTNRSFPVSEKLENNIDPNITSDEVNDESLVFIFVPLAVLGVILILAALVYYMASKQRQLFCYRRKVPSFSWADTDLSEDEDNGGGKESDYLLNKVSHVTYNKKTDSLLISQYSKNAELYA